MYLCSINNDKQLKTNKMENLNINEIIEQTLDYNTVRQEWFDKYECLRTLYDVQLKNY